MLQSTDRYEKRDIAIGDIARLPFRLRNGSIETTTWEVLAFGTGDMRHCVIALRRSDGHIQHLAMHHWRNAVGDADVIERGINAGRARHQRRHAAPRPWRRCTCFPGCRCARAAGGCARHDADMHARSDNRPGYHARTFASTPAASGQRTPCCPSGASARGSFLSSTTADKEHDHA